MSRVIARRLFLVLIGWIWAISAHAQVVVTDMTATSVAGVAAIVVDGELNDEGWQQAVPVTTFVQRDPLEGAAPSFKTEARVIYYPAGRAGTGAGPADRACEGDADPSSESGGGGSC